MGKSSLRAITSLAIEYWDLIASVVAGACAFFWLNPASIKDVAGDIVVYFGIQAAAILPAMIYAASILRPDGLTLDDVGRYRRALRRQMGFWVALLAVDLAASILMIIGKATDWKIAAPVAFLATDKPYAPGLVTIAAVLCTLAILRLTSFAIGIFSLLELNGTLVEKAVKARTLAQSAPPAADVPFETPPGYGEVVSRH